MRHRAQRPASASAPSVRATSCHAAGCAVWIGYQSIVNLGMVLGLLPVVGVPLPFVSFGGSSMLCLWLALGLLQSVQRSPGA